MRYTDLNELFQEGETPLEKTGSETFQMSNEELCAELDPDLMKWQIAQKTSRDSDLDSDDESVEEDDNQPLIPQDQQADFKDDILAKDKDGKKHDQAYIDRLMQLAGRR